MAKTYKAVQGFFCVVLVCVLVFNCFAIPHAKALTATMSLSLAVTALAVLLISSIGVTITAPSGQDVTDYVGTRFQSWVASRGYSDVGSWFTAQTKISIASFIASVFTGYIAVGKVVYDALKSFVSSFVTSEGIESGGDPVGDLPTSVTPTVTVDPAVVNPLTASVTASNVVHVVSNNMYTSNSSIRTSGCVFCIPINSSASSVSFQFSNWASNPNYGVSVYPYVSNYTTMVSYSSLRSYNVGQTNYTITIDNPNHYNYLCFGVYVNANYGQIYSFDITISNQHFDNAGGAVFAPDTNVLDLPAISSDESYQINSDVVSGSMSTTEALAAVGNLASTSTGIQVTAGVRDEPVNPPDTTPIEGLQSVFPFCLPFDFVRFLEIFSAQREAPRVEWVIPLASSGLGIPDQVIVIDLSDFDDLAATVRNVELIAMCVGLILLTRELMKW